MRCGVTLVNKRLLLVDGHSLANRAFYALPPLSTSDGTPTGAVFGFLSMLLRFLSEKRPSHVAIAFDLPGPTFRHVQYAEYKAQRKPAPPEFSAQIPVLKEVLDTLSLPRLEMQGYEADDIIGTLALKWKECGGSVWILSGDRDCLQLVDDTVSAILPVKGISQVKEYNPETVEEDLGVRPDQIRDYKALCGDSSDNIPGVKGVGGKTAVSLLKQFDNLDALYARIEEVSPPRVRNFLAANKEMAYLSRELATIDRSVPLDPCDLEDRLCWRAPDLEKVKALFTKLEFHSLIPRIAALAGSLPKGAEQGDKREEGDQTGLSGESARLGDGEKAGETGQRERGAAAVRPGKAAVLHGKGSAAMLPGEGDAPAQPGEGDSLVPGEGAVPSQSEPLIERPVGQPDLWEQARLPGTGKSAGGFLPGMALKPESFRPENAREIAGEAGLKEFAEEVRSTGTLGLYAAVEEVTKTFSFPPVIGVSSGRSLGVVRVDPGQEDILWDYLAPLLVSSDIVKIGFDLKWVFTFCFKRGITLRGAFFDILIAAYLIDPTRTNYRLEDLVRKYAGVDIPEMPKDKQAVQDTSLKAHLAAGAHACLGIAGPCRDELKHLGLLALAEEVEFPLIEVLAAMEATGIRPDLELGRSIRKSFADALRVLEDSIYAMAGEKFNLGSPKQLSHILFERLGLKPVKKTKTGWSTDAEVLETLSLEHELPAKILEHRHYAKLKSTYLDVLEEVTNPTTGRIHSTFHQTVTATGRLSSSEPNLQNIPVRGELGRSLRRIFIPEDGWLFLASDYSQIELRIMAHMSGDPTMIDAFSRGEDIHTRTASEIFGVPVDKVDYDLRSKAKAVNFGIIYGISDFGLARNTGVSIGEARTFIEAYFARYPKIREFMDRSIQTAREYGYVTTILGRRRPIPDINSRVRARRGFAERTAINTPIQGSAADIIKMAMVRIYRRLKEEGLRSRLILQVHDELIFEIPPEEEAVMRELVRSEMEGVISLKVPLKVDIDVGKSWFEV